MAPARRAGAVPKATWGAHKRRKRLGIGTPGTPQVPLVSVYLPPPLGRRGGARGAHGVRRTTYLNVPVTLPFKTSLLEHYFNVHVQS